MTGMSREAQLTLAGCGLRPWCAVCAPFRTVRQAGRLPRSEQHRIQYTARGEFSSRRRLHQRHRRYRYRFDCPNTC